MEGVARVHALDAHALDVELESILQSSLERVCCTAAGASTWERLKPELRMLLRGIIWYFSMGVDCRTAGQSLQNLHCTTAAARAQSWSRAVMLRAAQSSGSAVTKPQSGLSVWRRSLHGLLVVLLPWLWERVSQRVAAHDSDVAARVLRAMRRLEQSAL